MMLVIFTVSFGKIKNKITLQETAVIDLKVRGSRLKTRYVVRFSTENKKDNFKILSREKDIDI